MPAPVHKVFIGGGGDDWFSHIVENYEAAYRSANPAVRCSYYSWTQTDEVQWALNLAPDTADLTVVGHSYGADCAFGAVARCPRRVNTLISIDPVGRLRPAWVSIRARCVRWLNVRAEPSTGRRTTDDTIAWIGGKYPRPPARGEPGAPDYGLVADATHGDFRSMMRQAGAGGMSGRQLLGGNYVR